MFKRKVFILGFLFLTLLCNAGDAFVPKAPHLLYLVIQKIKQPVGIEAFQTQKIIHYSETQPPYTEFEERLLYAYPDRLRAELISGPEKGFSVESNLEFAKVRNGYVVSRQKSLPDRYSDILLYRNYESLLALLADAGVDTDQVSLQRYRDTVCYVIGASLETSSPFAGLWIEKDTFFPVKYVVSQNGRVVEFFYGKWQRVSKTWYPMQTSIFSDDRLHAMVNVKRYGLKSFKSESMFNIDTLSRAYPDEEKSDAMDKNSRQVNELEKDINTVEKIFD